jgi:L,D-peptidoglycan transpeptidase YkuD (ErfK/YbiS/YcfS/YnhG family)
MKSYSKQKLVREMQRFREQHQKPVKNKRATMTVRSAPGNRQRAIVNCAGMTIKAAIGRSGTSAFKREGDGATPIAAMKLMHGFWRGERLTLPPTALPMRRIKNDMLWCDEPKHPAYNRLVKAPFRPSHEEMQRADGLYDICLVLDWNITTRKRYGGSAIFFHLIKPGYQPTAGCVAVSVTDMRRLLQVMRPGMVVKVLG